MITLRVDNRVRIPIRGLSDEALQALREAFTYKNPDYDKARRFRLRGKPPPKAVASWKNDDGDLTVPRGGMQRVRDVLAAHSIEWRAVDGRELGEEVDIPEVMRFAPYDFQREMVQTVIHRENVLLRAPTGSGKTVAAFLIANAVKTRTLVIVATRGLFDQWVRELQTVLGMRRSSIGEIRGGKCTIGDITIGMQKSLVKVVGKVAHQFGCVICDEAQLFAAKTFFAVVDHLPARYRVGISADERRKDRKEFLLYDVFGPVAFEVKRDELIDRGVVLDVEVRMFPTDFDAAWFHELRDAEQRVNEAREEKRKPDPEDAALVSRELVKAFDRVLTEMGENVERNALASRVALAAVEEGHQALVFSHRREHCHRLRADIAARDPTVGLMIGGGGEDGVEYDRALEGLRDGSTRLAVGTYQALGTGINLPSVGRGVATTPVHMNRPFFGQVRGRLCRLGKEDAALLYLWDVKLYGLAPLRNMVRWNRKVFVWCDGEWRPGRAVLKEREREEKERREAKREGVATIGDFLDGDA